MERFSRTQILLGTKNFKKLQSGRITVIGLGAVGSYCVEGLARAGVERLRLVDFDVIRPSNINRHLWATEETLGRLKIDVGRQRILDINPAADVEAMELFADEKTMDTIVSPRPDVVLDAIDSLNPKIQILTYCARQGIPVLSSMGAATRTDPLAVRIGDIFDTKNCPLAERIRRRLRKNGVARGAIRCVFSEQKQNVGMLAGAAEREPGEYQRGRVRRPLGSLPTLTGIFGLTLAQMAIEFLLKKDTF